jgi:nicotinamidase-related amidase
MQPVFIRAIKDGAEALRRCEFAVTAACGLGVPILFTEQVPEKLGPTAPELAALAPSARIFPKKTFSALGDEAIRRAILDPEFAVEHLLLCGIETSVCVYQTAVDALAAGLEVTILSDCMGARRADDARTCLAFLSRAGAHVLPSETVFYSMLHDVTHSFFKPYTRLVKRYG